MREATALDVAANLLQLPSRVRLMRDGELPSDVELLLRVVAGDADAIADAMRMANLPESSVQEAASFFIEQIMLHPDADSYRALGVGPDATTEQLRRNMALLLRWLHPDREVNSARAVYVGRVTQAWNNLKTAERRASYDETRQRTIAVKAAADRRHAVRKSSSAPRSESILPHAHRTSGALARRTQNAPYGRSTSERFWHFLRQLLARNCF
jgi:hypothetical protein